MHNTCFQQDVDQHTRVMMAQNFGFIARECINVCNKQGYTPLGLACMLKPFNIKLVETLLQIGADPSAGSINNVLHDAPYHFDDETGVVLFQKIFGYWKNKAVLNKINLNGFTPLHIAVLQNRPKMAKMLIDAGCNKECQSFEGKKAADYAIFGNSEIKELFL